MAGIEHDGLGTVEESVVDKVELRRVGILADAEGADVDAGSQKALHLVVEGRAEILPIGDEEQDVGAGRRAEEECLRLLQAGFEIGSARSPQGPCRLRQVRNSVIVNVGARRRLERGCRCRLKRDQRHICVGQFRRRDHRIDKRLKRRDLGIQDRIGEAVAIHVRQGECATNCVWHRAF